MSSNDWLNVVYISAVLGPFVIGGFCILVIRAGLSPVRYELERLADATAMQNEISLDDDLRASAN